MPVPLSVLNTIFVNESFLKRDQLGVRSLNTLRSLDKLLDRRLAHDDFTQPVYPVRDRAFAGAVLARELAQQLPELLLRFCLLVVQLGACMLQFADGAAKRAEFDGVVERQGGS